MDTCTHPCFQTNKRAIYLMPFPVRRPKISMERTKRELPYTVQMSIPHSNQDSLPATIAKDHSLPLELDGSRGLAQPLDTLLPLSLHGGNTMPNSDLLPLCCSKSTKTSSRWEPPLGTFKLGREARICGSCGQGSRRLAALDRNEEFIKIPLAVMVAPE